MLSLWLSLKIWWIKGNCKGGKVWRQFNELHFLLFTLPLFFKGLSFEEFITAGPIYQGRVRLRLRAFQAPLDKQAHFA